MQATHEALSMFVSSMSLDLIDWSLGDLKMNTSSEGTHTEAELASVQEQLTDQTSLLDYNYGIYLILFNISGDHCWKICYVFKFRMGWNKSAKMI